MADIWGRRKSFAERWFRPRPSSIPLPSLNFLLLLLIFTGSAMLLSHGWIEAQGLVIVFVVTGWIVSLCLHEYGHALVAYIGGDRSIAQTGYLTLDPLHYTDPFLSIVLPLIYIVIGGFGLPGGAVYINRESLRSPLWGTLVSLAGPAMNLLFLLFLAGLFFIAPDNDDAVTAYQAALAALAFFQATAIVLNMLPLPGLDGFGVIEPLMPPHIALAGRSVAAGAGFFLIFLVISSRQVGHVISRVGSTIIDALGVYGAYDGLAMLRLF
jgi:Zn-dependent protease